MTTWTLAKRSQSGTTTVSFENLGGALRVRTNTVLKNTAKTLHVLNRLINPKVYIIHLFNLWYNVLVEFKLCR